MSLALFGALLAAPTVSEASMSIGDRGNSVGSLQDALANNGYMTQPRQFRGTFGPQTRSAVQAFQRDEGISSPRGNFYGVAGPATVRALGVSSGGNATASTTTASASNSSGGSSGVVSAARNVVGSPYQWGGTTPRGFDCSGFINYAFNQTGKSIPRTVAGMWSAGSSVSNPQVGDIVFFSTVRSGPSHAGIYVGNNQFIHAGSSTGVTVSSMSTPYWSNSYLGAKRL